MSGASNGGKRLAYADPPYPGKAELYADHPDYAGEVDHARLIARLSKYDGWALSTGSWALQDVLEICPPGVRILIWTKHSIARSWEPVIVVPARNEAHVRRLRDWIQVEPEYFQWRPKPESYVIGQKPERFCRWLFEWLGARPDDTLDDLFPGSGAVTEAWERWRGQPSLLPLLTRNERRARLENEALSGL